MSLKVGDLYVSLTARTDRFSRDMAKIGKDIAKTSKQVKNLSKDVAQLGAPLALAIAGSVAAAAKVNPEMEKVTKKLKGLFLTAGAEIGIAFLPAVKAVADSVSRVVAALQNMDPELKATIASWLSTAVAVTAGAAAFSKVAAFAEGIGKALTFLGKTAGPLTSGFIVPIIGIVAAVGSIIVVVGALRRAWDSNWNGMRDTGLAMWKTISAGAGKFFEIFAKVFGQIKRVFLDIVKTIVDGWIAMFDLVGIDTSGMKKFVEGAFAAVDKFLTVEGISGAFDGLVEVGKKAGQNLAINFKAGLETLGITGLMDDVKKKLGIGSGKGAVMAKPLDEQRKRAADELKMIVEKAKEFAKAVAERFKEAYDHINGLLTQNLGRAGSLIDSAAAGATLGGPIGAAGAVALDLLMSSKTMQTTIAVLDDFLRQMADAIGPVLEAMQPLIVLLGPFVKVVSALAKLFSGPLSIAFRVLFEVLKGVATVIVTVLTFLGDVWNGMVNYIESQAKLGAYGMAGVKLAEAGFYGGIKADTKGLHDALTELQSITYDTAAAKFDEIAATIGVTEAMQDATEALTNVPSGYKVALARLASMDAAVTQAMGIGGAQSFVDGIPHFAEGGVVTKPTVALVGEKGPERITPLGQEGGGVINVTVVSNDPERIWAQIKQLARRDRYRMGGTTAMPTPRYAGA